MTFLSVVEAVLVFAQATGLRRIARLSLPASQKIHENVKCTSPIFLMLAFKFAFAGFVLVSVCMCVFISFSFIFHFALKPVSNRFADPVTCFPVLRPVCQLISIKFVWQLWHSKKFRNKFWAYNTKPPHLY